jgi:Tol biopolymer transport system component
MASGRCKKLRVPFESVAAVVLATISIGGVAHYNSSVSNSSPANTSRKLEFFKESRSTVRDAADNQNAGVIIFERVPEKTGAGPERDIYSVNADGTNEKALTHDGHSHSPSWSPDGKRILFIHDAALRTPMPYEVSGDRTRHPLELYVMNRDGGNPRLIQRFESEIHQAAWSPDGTVILVDTVNFPPNSLARSLYLVSPDGRGDPRLLFPYDSGSAAWSPDGKRIFFSRRSEQNCAPIPDPIPPALRALISQMPCWPWTPWVANGDGSNAVQLLVKNNISYPTIQDPAWSPDAKQIAFASAVDSSWSSQIFLMNEDGSGVQQLTNDPGWVNCEHPSWRADSLQITFSCKPRWTFCAEHSDTGRPIIPWCVRRLFVISASNPTNILTPLNDNNGSMPTFSPN